MSHPVETSMKQTALVTRPTTPALNPWRQADESRSQAETVYSALGCKVWASTERRLSSDGAFFRATVVKMRTLGTAELELGDTVTVDGNSYKVVTAILRNHHLLVELEHYGGV